MDGIKVMSDDFNKQFLELQRVFIDNLPERKQRINALLSQLYSNELQQNIVINLHREVHNLTGAAGCYQFKLLAAESRKVENYLSGVLGNNQVFLQDPKWQEQLGFYIAGLTKLIDEEVK